MTATKTTSKTLDTKGKKIQLGRNNKAKQYKTNLGTEPALHRPGPRSTPELLLRVMRNKISEMSLALNAALTPHPNPQSCKGEDGGQDPAGTVIPSHQRQID